jgi:ornithine--oxo-acid transaminase
LWQETAQGEAESESAWINFVAGVSGSSDQHYNHTAPHHCRAATGTQELSMFDLKKLVEDHRGQALELIEKHVNPTFAKVLRTIGFDIEYVRGKGPYLWDAAGNRYIDCLSGFGQFGVGRNHPTVQAAIRQAMELELAGLPKFGPATLSGLLARELISIAPGELDTVYFCNSGAEGCETAIKYARCATGRNRIIYCKRGYHGLTMGALSVMGGDEFRQGFGSLLTDTTLIPFNDLESLERELGRGDAAGFIVEPVQGKGVHVAAEGYLAGAAELCRKHGAVFIADEVQTGFGRTGRMFAVEHWGVQPDILVTSKALSGGCVPVGAVLSKRWIHDKVFHSMDRVLVHSTTFGQNDLAMAAGLATLQVLRQERLVENAAERGRELIAGLSAMVGRHEMVKEVRGKGLMVAVEYGPPRSMTLKMGWSLLHKVDSGLFPQAILIPLLRDHRILAQTAGHHQDTVKLLPALVIGPEDVRAIVQAIDRCTAACHQFPGPVWEIGKRLGQFAVKRAAVGVT